tara:strand:- start:122 stop:670 length:549 start_codon:yes stop_codon:yes gene_type:complete
MPRAIDVAKQKWLEFNSQPFATEMELEQKVHIFTEGLSSGLRQWDAFKAAPESIFLLIAVKGIEKSRTHLRLELEPRLGIPIPAPHERTDEEELAVLKERLIDRAARTWSYFQERLTFSEQDSLEQQIAAFRIPFAQGVRADYPMFCEATDSEFDSMIAVGIERSGTHSIIEVCEALGDIDQ